MLNKFLGLFGLQKIPKEKSLKQIEREECEHEWEEVYKNFTPYSRYSILYCPKCDYSKRVEGDMADVLIKSSRLRKIHLENKQFDVLDERIRELEQKEKISK